MIKTTASYRIDIDITILLARAIISLSYRYHTLSYRCHTPTYRYHIVIIVIIRYHIGIITAQHSVLQHSTVIRCYHTLSYTTIFPHSITPRQIPHGRNEPETFVTKTPYIYKNILNLFERVRVPIEPRRSREQRIYIPRTSVFQARHTYRTPKRGWPLARPSSTLDFRPVAAPDGHEPSRKGRSICFPPFEHRVRR